MRKALAAAFAWTLKNVHILAAVPFLVLAFVLIIADRIGAATLSAAIFLILVLLPDLDSLKAFGLFEANLKKARELLEKLSAVARATGDLTYQIIGPGSRSGGLATSDKQKLADASDAMMIQLGVTPAELAEKRSSYIQFALYDLYSVFSGIVVDNAGANSRKYTLRVGSDFNSDETLPDVIKLRADAGALSEVRGSKAILSDLATFGFRQLCHRAVPDKLLPPEDAKRLHDFADRLSDIADAVTSGGRITSAAADFIDTSLTRDERKALYRQIFGEELER